MNSKNCTKGTSIAQIPDECNGGNFLSTNCVQTPNSLVYLDLPAGSNQTQINAAIIASLTYKDQEISEIPIYDGSETKVEAGENTSITGIGSELDPYIVNSILLPVSSIISGIVNNTSLQELGGVDKLINNVRIGKGNGTGVDNTVIGENALVINNASYNTAVGKDVLTTNIIGRNNTGVGAYALSNSTSNNNVALGYTALAFSTTGERNVGLGSGALYSSTIGFRNVAVGTSAMERNTTGGNNVAIGHQAGGNLSTGTGNILVGAQNIVNIGLSTGSNNTLIIPNNSLITGITTGSGNTILGRVTGLEANLNNNVILADGIGGIVFRSLDTGLTTIPKQTNSLITSDSTGKAIVTKEYLPSVSGNYANDTEATTGGVLLGQMYHTNGTVKIRIT
ncbi:MAG TPA: hypothetical protein VLA48_03325 [Nitrososphaeraceae archaeon]|nr:hypothetical protein [Nitrososphaeraceae archaeon]